jgi:hypothetical protein
MLYSASVEELAKPVVKEEPKEELKEEVVQEASPPAEPEAPPKEKKKRVRKPKEPKAPVEIPVEPKKRVSKKKNLDEQIEEKKKEIAKVKTIIAQKTKKTETDDPPVWFKSFIKNMKAQENLVSKEKKSKKKIGAEVEQEAVKQWNDDHTRDRITNQANKHLDQMQKLYHQMFRR